MEEETKMNPTTHVENNLTQNMGDNMELMKDSMVEKSVDNEINNHEMNNDAINNNKTIETGSAVANSVDNDGKLCTMDVDEGATTGVAAGKPVETAGKLTSVQEQKNVLQVDDVAIEIEDDLVLSSQGDLLVSSNTSLKDEHFSDTNSDDDGGTNDESIFLTPAKSQTTTSKVDDNVKKYPIRGKKNPRTPAAKVRRQTVVKTKTIQTAKTELAQLKSTVDTLLNAVAILEDTVKKQQEEIVNLQQVSTQPTTIPASEMKEDNEMLRKEISSVHQQMVNFYSDNEKKCSKNLQLFKQDINKSMNNMVRDIADLQQNITKLPVEALACPMSTKIGALELDIERVEHELGHVVETISTLELPNSKTVGGGTSPMYIFGNNPISKTPKSAMAGKPSISISTSKEKRDVSVDYSKEVTLENEHFESGSNNMPKQQKLNENLNKSENTSRNDKRENKGYGQRRRKILMMMDSNRQFLDTSRLWDNLHIEPCGNIPDVTKALQHTDLSKYDVIIVHVGVNDVDRHNGATVAQKLAQLSKSIVEAAPHAKILMSEVTPRQLSKDDEVLECNEILPNLVDSAVTLIHHSNLRNEEWSFHVENDDKHLAAESIARFAGNLKTAFRKAIGVSRSPAWKGNRRGGPRRNNGDQR